MHPRSAFRRAACLAALVLAAGCEHGMEPGREGVFDGTWAGARFDGEASAVLVGDSVYIVGGLRSGRDYTHWLAVAIGEVRGPGEYPLGAGGAEMRYLAGGDGIWASYATTQPGAGRVVITSTRGATVVGHVQFDAEVGRGLAPVGPRASFDAEFRAPVEAHALRPIGS
jgi:hypothetical protein